jgi:hypothetical protein
LKSRGTTLVGCRQQPTRYTNGEQDLCGRHLQAIGSPANAGVAAQTTWLGGFFVNFTQRFPWAAREGTSTSFGSARVSVYALASLSVLANFDNQSAWFTFHRRGLYFYYQDLTILIICKNVLMSR